MKKFILEYPKKPAFVQRGLKGYRFPLKNKRFEVYYVDVMSGHDNFIISRKITHVYYILKGNGIFETEGEQYKVKQGDLVEVSPGVEYTYSGQMQLLLIMNPPWFQGNEKIARKNPAVSDDVFF